jgi:hypothetical protein
MLPEARSSSNPLALLRAMKACAKIKGFGVRAGATEPKVSPATHVDARLP